MNEDRPVRVTLLGDRSGDYVVVGERSDGSLVLAPDTSRDPRGGHGGGSIGSSISRLLTRRGSGPATIHEALDGWGFVLAEDEFVTDFLTAKDDRGTGFAAVTNRRVAFFARRGPELRAIAEYPLSDVRKVELVRGPFKSVLRIGWDDGETQIEGELDVLARVRCRLGGG